MNDAIKFLSNFESRQKGLTRVAFVALAISAMVSIGAVAAAFSYVKGAENKVYVLDEGAAMEARRAANGEQKDLEVIDHVTRFHEMFYNIAPNITTINQNVGRALELADESAYKYFEDLKEQRYFNTLVNINATQQISVDSVVVDIYTYPYKAKAYNSLYVLRESTIALYSLETECELTEVSRSVKNPHGLMMRRFYATKPQLVEQRSRN